MLLQIRHFPTRNHNRGVWHRHRNLWPLSKFLIWTNSSPTKAKGRYYRRNRHNERGGLYGRHRNMPISRHERMMRTAISPRLAIRTFLIICNTLRFSVCTRHGKILLAYFTQKTFECAFCSGILFFCSNRRLIF